MPIFLGRDDLGSGSVLRDWIERCGVPHAPYINWKNVYMRAASEAEQCAGQAPVTQFGGMCEKLGIRIIAASSPQAKGGVERAHGTHQDRLLKKLRLAGIAGYNTGNRYLVERYARRRRRPPIITADDPRRDNSARCSGWKKNGW